jgi:hypothetical protein
VYDDGHHEVKILKVMSRQHYFLRRERVTGDYLNSPKDLSQSRPPVDLTVAYDLKGRYLGNPDTALVLCRDHGIEQFELASPTNKTLSVGFSPSKNRWFGWSHRAICGFSIGDKLFDEEAYATLSDKTPFRNAGKTTIRTLDQAKQAAINFAKYIS